MLPFDWHNPGYGGGSGGAGGGGVYRGGGYGGGGAPGIGGAGTAGPLSSGGALAQALRKRLMAGRLPELGNTNPDFNPSSGRGQPQIEYPIPPPPPVDREAQLRHSMNPGQINPYRGIPGFEHYSQPDLNVPGDALSKFFRRKLLAEGYPTRERVGQISDALGNLQGFHYPTRNYGGQGVDVGQSDLLRKLLEQRMGGGSY